MQNIDETDIKILEKLKQNGRKPYSEIAKELNLATSTVAGRVKKMKEQKIIKGFNTLIDYEKLGFNLTAMIAIKAKSEKIPETAETLKNKPRVISFYEVTGKTDMLLISRFQNRENMNQFIKQLQKTPGIHSTETNVILTTPKINDNMDLQKTLY